MAAAETRDLMHMSFQPTAFALLLCHLLIPSGVMAVEKTSEQPIEREFNRVYCQRDNDKLLADIYRPAGKGPYPAILMIHGGAWMSGSKWNLIQHANRAARAGYVVVVINYRLAPRHPFPAQIDDCRQAVRWMRKESESLRIDSRRIAAYGYSAGGHLSCLLALSASHPKTARDLADTRVIAVVAGGAPCDFRHLDENVSTLAYFLGGTRREKAEAYRRASPAEFSSSSAPPIHFFHGNRDRLVPIASSQRLYRQLKTAGVPVSYDEVKESGHLATFLDGAAAERALEFLDRHMRNTEEMPTESTTTAQERR
jgi:triacylglycerol lipase